MDWKLIDVIEEPCKCGKGKVTTHVIGDIWGRVDTAHRLECDECNKKYDLMPVFDEQSPESTHMEYIKK